MTANEVVIRALLADLHHQVHESVEDGYGLLVGPNDVLSIVRVEGPVDVDAPAAAIVAALEGRHPQSAPSGLSSPGETQAAYQTAGEVR